MVSLFDRIHPYQITAGIINWVTLIYKEMWRNVHVHGYVLHLSHISEMYQWQWRWGSKVVNLMRHNQYVLDLPHQKGQLQSGNDSVVVHSSISHNLMINNVPWICQITNTYVMFIIKTKLVLSVGPAFRVWLIAFLVTMAIFNYIRVMNFSFISD